MNKYGDNEPLENETFLQHLGKDVFAIIYLLIFAGCLVLTLFKEPESLWTVIVIMSTIFMIVIVRSYWEFKKKEL